MAKGGKVSQSLVWVLLALLIIGLGGFGITSFGGSVRSIGSVGSQDIGTNEYARALQQELAALSAQVGRNVPFAEGAQYGVDRTVRQRLVTTAALDHEAERIGLSVGDARLAREIRGIAAFGGMSGQFDRDAYRFALEQGGFSEAQFESRVRQDLARSLLQAAIAEGSGSAEALAQIFYDYVAESRGFSLLRLTEADLPEPLAAPSAEDLRNHYEANPETFTRPEARRITWTALLPETMIDQVEVDEARLRAVYDQRITEFVQPERRLVERLVFPSDEAAEAARNRLDAGAVAFEDLVSERGLDLLDIDLGDVAEADLGQAGAVIFAADAPAVVGPLASPLGPALFRVNGVLAAQEVTYDEAREQLLGEFATDAARRLIADRIDEIDDLLAGGATLEDLEADAGMQLGTMDMLPGGTEGMAAYPAFRERAASVRERDFPEVFQLDDGGIAALRLDEVLPPALLPFDEVADQVAEDWRRSALRAALDAALEAAEADVAEGGALGTHGIVTVVQAMTREGFVENAPQTLLPTVFAMAEGEVRRISGNGFAGLVRLDSIRPADNDSPEAVLLKAAFAAQTEQDIAQDVFTLFAAAMEQAAGINLNEAAINAVHAQMR